MAHFVSKGHNAQQNYYFKNDLCYTEDHIPVQKLYLHNIPAGLKECTLLSYFTIFGNVVDMQIFGKGKNRRMPQRGSGSHHQEQQRGGKWQMKTGYVVFASPCDAAKALFVHVHHVNGHRLHVKASDSWHQPEAYGSDDKNQPDGEAHILKISDHCLSQIFQFLSLADQLHFSRVCMRFRGIYLLLARSVHKSMDFSQFDGLTVWDMRDFFTLSGRYVQSFQGIMPAIRIERLCDYFGANCVNVKSLEIAESKLSLRNMHKLFANTDKLENLRLSGCGLTDGCLMALKKLKNLKKLNLAYNSKTNGFDLDKLPVTIETLNLTACTGILGIRLVQMCKTLNKLKDLNIVGVSPANSNLYESFNKKHCCRSLETLSLSIDEQSKYEEIAKLRKLKNIIFVTLPGYNMRAKLFDQLVALKSNQLESLEIHGAKNMNRNLLMQIGKFSVLRKLVLVGVETIKDDILEEFTKLSQLEHLGLRVCSNVSDNAVMRIILGCPKLHVVHLDDCTEISDKLVHTIIKKVQHQVLYKENVRQLPIQLYVKGTNIPESIETHPEVFAAKNIIKIRFDSEYIAYLLHLSLSNLLLDDFEYNPNELEMGTDDEMDFFDDNYMFDMGFLSDSDADSDVYDI